MSNIDKNTDYEDFSIAIDFILNEFKKELNVCIPAIIDSYDRSKKRAIVQIATQKITSGNESVKLPKILDVPHLCQGGGGYLLNTNLKKGDGVLVIFSNRCISKFKDMIDIYTPDNYHVLDINDAMIVATFVKSVSSEDKISLQSIDGEKKIAISDNSIILKNKNAVFEIHENKIISNVPIEAPSVVANNIKLETHVHIDSNGKDVSPPK